MKKAIFVLFSFFLLFLFFGCTQTTLSEEQKAIGECEILCNSSLKSATDLSKGQCLANSLESMKWQQGADWACDIAHNPRQAIDDLPANQCSAFPAQAKHFVELDTECNLIKIN